VLERLAPALRAARAAGADDVEVTSEERELGATRFANSYPTQAGSIVERTTRVRAALGQRLGAATTSGLDAAALAEAARRAVENAAKGPPAPHFRGFGRGATAGAARVPAGATGVAAATAAFGPADRAAVLARAFERAARDGFTCAGAFTTQLRRRAVLTAGGVAVAHALTEAAISLIALEGRVSGYAVWAGGDVARLDAGALAEAAVGGAARARDPTGQEPGALDVVLSPSAVSELCEWMAMASFSARGTLDGTSLLSGRGGERICDPRVSIVEDAGYEHPDRVAWPTDIEGTPRARVAFVERGVAGGPVSDLGTAARLGAPSTGHACPFGLDLGDDPVPANLVFLPGDASVDELIARVERGLYVTRFHYVNGLLDTRRATMTGMTRDGAFQILGGKLGRAVHNLRFTENILDALGRVGGIGRELAAIPTHWMGVGNYLCPALLIRDFRFTGRSRKD
jgi:predicted Zn-dependent protease